MPQIAKALVPDYDLIELLNRQYGFRLIAEKWLSLEFQKHVDDVTLEELERQGWRCECPR